MVTLLGNSYDSSDDEAGSQVAKSAQEQSVQIAPDVSIEVWFPTRVRRGISQSNNKQRTS